MSLRWMVGGIRNDRDIEMSVFVVVSFDGERYFLSVFGLLMKMVYRMLLSVDSTG